MTIVTETMTDINYVGFDKAGRLACYDSAPIPVLPLVVPAADIVALFRTCEGFFIDVRGAAPVKVTQSDYHALIRDLGMHFCATANDYLSRGQDCGECVSCATADDDLLPVNADGHDFGGAY